jgi:hypothetical protein
MGAATIIVAGLVMVGWLRAHYNAWVWQSLPDQFSVCGRDYLGPGDIVSLDQMIANGDHVIAHVRTFASSHEVWGVEDGPDGDRCGTGVYVQRDSQSFRAYALSGGP